MKKLTNHVIRLALLLCVLFVFASCSSEQHEKKMQAKRFSMFLNQLVEVSVLNDSTIFNDDIPYYTSAISSDSTLVYILDASCSACIADFCLIFDSFLLNSNWHLSLYIPEEEKDKFDYLIEPIFGDMVYTNNRTSVYEIPQDLYSEDISNNNFFVFIRNKIVANSSSAAVVSYIDDK